MIEIEPPTSHEEHLDREVGFDVGLAQEREYLAAGQLFDHLAVAVFHHALEAAAHLEHPFGLAAFDHCAFDRGEAVAEHAHDQVVENVGLGFDRPASVVLPHQRDDPVGDFGEQLAALARPECRIGARGLAGPGVAHFAALGARQSALLLTGATGVRFAGSGPNLGDLDPWTSARSASTVFMSC